MYLNTVALAPASRVPHRNPHKTRGKQKNDRLVISEIKVYLRLRSINSISPCRLIVYNSYNTEIYCIWRHHLFHLDFLISIHQTRYQYLSHRAEPGSFHSSSLIPSLQLIPLQSTWPGAGPSHSAELHLLQREFHSADEDVKGRGKGRGGHEGWQEQHKRQ